jgi:xanthosine utilization system XapX-like protein
MYGENQGVVAGTGLPLHVTLNLVIPEFPVLALPIVGIVGLFVAVSVVSRRG